MEWLIILGLLVALGVGYDAAYRSGKQVGSRKAYGVGYARGRRAANQGGCLVLLLAGLALMGVTAVLLAR